MSPFFHSWEALPVLRAYLLFQEWLDKFLVVTPLGQRHFCYSLGRLMNRYLSLKHVPGAELGSRPRLCLHGAYRPDRRQTSTT